MTLLIVIDMQNDFVTGALGTAEAVAIVPKVIEKIIAELERKLRDDQLSEEELSIVTHQISALNQERILIAKRLSRLIL